MNLKNVKWHAVSLASRKARLAADEEFFFLQTLYTKKSPAVGMTVLL